MEAEILTTCISLFLSSPLSLFPDNLVTGMVRHLRPLTNHPPPQLHFHLTYSLLAKSLFQTSAFHVASIFGSVSKAALFKQGSASATRSKRGGGGGSGGEYYEYYIHVYYILIKMSSMLASKIFVNKILVWI